ncbi:FAD-binding oxidoreductase [Thermoactinomyces sp. DSM 45892]|uniref:NAD(P)/FAD-dependent oxidoreductase n=1 Tax=Thermoactinomyces sp. DSM 45892 TaxID=1882753 RepID=UPI0008947A69|nr:FAD-dependent oxidoreductase [Thermoactinomyces sp. DSM 45892]SDY52631.1 Glycine/D-amino acid oxidase [Thermoactinomyces sp. DSM 45892]
MRYVAGNCLWTAQTTVPKQYPYLTTDIQTEVVVIGGGLAGAITAYQFAKAGIQTVLVERTIIGYLSTRASTSILQYEIDTNMVQLQSMYGIDTAVRSFQLCFDAVSDLEQIVQTLDDDCEFSRSPCLYYSPKKNDVRWLEREFNLRRKHGFPVEWVQSEENNEHFSFPIAGGILSTGGAGMVNPYRLTHALLRAAEKAGVQIYENTDIDKIYDESSNGQTKVTTQHGFHITAKKIVICTGYEAKNLIRGQRLGSLARTFNIVTKPYSEVPGWYDRCIIRDTDEPYTYVRGTKDQRIIIGGEDVNAGGASSKISNLDDEDPLVEQQYSRLLTKLQELFPHLQVQHSDIEFRYHALFNNTKDGLPFIGQVNYYPNCYFNLGYGSNGILSVLTGSKLLLDLYQGTRSPDLDLFDFQR